MSQPYISEIDYLLADLAQQYPKPSKNQLKEIDKYKRINQLRDKVQDKASSDYPQLLWQGF